MPAYRLQKIGGSTVYDSECMDNPGVTHHLLTRLFLKDRNITTDDAEKEE